RVNTQEVIAYLDTVVDGERQFGIHSTFIYTWHALLQRYLEGPPSDWIHHLARTHQHFHYAGRRTVAAWDQVLVETAAREEVRQFVQQLVEQFSQLLGSATPAQATSI
ncbi:MAG: hypothetical protein KDK78_05800, partial [Chlamydiia bacterium]|nr:hypothetical protein [Chlamydiia bacterium]